MSQDAGSDKATERSVDRLFVALPLPGTAAAMLAGLQPPVAKDVRLTAPADMHVTLHFLGQAPASAVAATLGGIEAPAFPVRLSAAGHFVLKGRRRILWVGVEPTAPLISLHAQVAAFLAALGFETQARPYVPHITLARLGPEAAPGIVGPFERQTLPPGAREFSCGHFALYASETAPDGARYRVLERFSLQTPD